MGTTEPIESPDEEQGSSAPRVLVAARPELHEVAQRVLGRGFSMSYCETMEEAERLLALQKTDLIVVTLRFDDSRMFELLKYMKSHASTREVPFAAVVLEHGLLDDEIIENVLKAAELMGIDERVNLPRWRRELGEEAADEKLRSRLHQLCTRDSKGVDQAGGVLFY